MFSVKIINNKEKRSQDFSNTVNNVISYIFNKLYFANSKVISDSSCIEIVSGKEVISNDNEVVIELLIRKHIVINTEDFKDKEKLDEHISSIKHFCEQAKNIEDLKYLPITMR